MKSLQEHARAWRHLSNGLAVAGSIVALGAVQIPSACADGLADAKGEVAKAMEKPQFVAPGGAVEMSKLKGKHVWIITSTMAVPFVATIAQGVQAAGKIAGIETSLFDGKGNVSEWN